VKSQPMLHIVIIICGLLLLVDFGIAFYHTGVEYGWFKAPDGCSSGNTSNMTLEEMRAAIMAAPLVSCSQAMAYIFGFSMAAWNALLAFAAGLATFFTLRKIK